MQKIRKQSRNVPNLRFNEFYNLWEEKRLGHIAKFLKGKGISKNDIVENGKTKCIRYGQLYTHYGEVIEKILSATDKDISRLILSEKNDVIIPSSGETPIDIAKASCVLKSGVALGGDLNIIKTKFNGVFLSYYLNHKKKTEISGLAQGSSVVHLYSKQLSKLNIYIPSRKEQNKISSFLILLDKRISTQNKIIEELKLLKHSLSRRLLNLQVRFPNFKDDWKVKNIGDICEIIGGGTPNTDIKAYWNGNIQWFTPTEIKVNYVLESQRKISELGLKKSSAKILPKGAILLTSRATIGEVAIALKECSTNQGFQSLVVKEGYNNIFIMNWIKIKKKEFIKRANGSTFPEISKSEIEKMKIILPDLPEQEKIAMTLSKVDEKLEFETSLLKKYRNQKKYFLKNLFI